MTSRSDCRAGDENSSDYRRGGNWASLLLFRLILLGLLLFLFLLLVSCERGRITTKEPVHLNPSMDYQPKYEAQEASDFFVNGASNRLQVAGTVARGQLFDDIAFYEGKDPDTGEYIEQIPFDLSVSDRDRGAERYQIYCSMCHGVNGLGDGIVIKKGFFPPPDYHEDKVQQLADGQIFHTISEGVNNMPSYKQQIPVRDRWLIVDHVRSLQKAASIDVASEK